MARHPLRVMFVRRTTVRRRADGREFPKVVVIDSLGREHSAIDLRGRLARLADRLCDEQAPVVLRATPSRYGSQLTHLARATRRATPQEGGAA